MNISRDYDVLRLIEHNRCCYVSTDVVKGCSLVQWVKYHPYLEKQQLNQWIHAFAQQLIQILKCRGNPCYQYVNPYSIIVSEDRKLCFLDMKSDSNQEVVKMMQRKNIREYFLPGGCSYRDADEELDIYGLGKTIQYLLATAEIEPRLTRREERNIRKMITKCIEVDKGKGGKKITDIQKYLSALC